MIVTHQLGLDERGDYVYELFLTSFDGRERRQLTNMKTIVEDAVLVPGSQTVVFVASESPDVPGALWKVSLAGGTPTKLPLTMPK